MRGRLPKSGSYTGDGSNAAVVDIGFKPVHVVIWNETDGDVKCEILDNGADGVAFKIVDSGTDTTNLSKISSNAPKLGARGFSSGTDASLIESGKVFRWAAF